MQTFKGKINRELLTGVVKDDTWNLYDMSSYVSAEATGVAIAMVSNDVSISAMVRTPGHGISQQTVNKGGEVENVFFVGLNQNKEIEISCAPTDDIDFYIVGELSNNIVFLDSEVNIVETTGSGEYIDIDISSNIAAADSGNVAAAIFLFKNSHGDGKNYSLEYRTNGYTSPWEINVPAYMYRQGVVAIDSNEIFEINAVSVGNLILIGYVLKNPLYTIFNEPILLPAPATEDAWVTYDMSPYIPDDATTIIFHKMFFGSDVRAVGSSDSQGDLAYQEILPLSENQEIEVYSSSINSFGDLVGYEISPPSIPNLAALGGVSSVRYG